MIFRLLAIAATVGWSGALAFAQTAPSSELTRELVLALPPAELLRAFPAVDPEWQMTSSTANNFFSDWVMAVAERKYKREAPPESGASGTGARKPPMLLRIRVSDTGRWPGFTTAFSQTAAAGADALQIDGMPAIKRSPGETKESIRLLINRRFIVQIDTENQPAGAAEAWAKRLDFSRLRAVPDSKERNVPNPVIISRIDEFRPEKNSTYPLHWATAEDLENDEREASR